MAEALLLLRSQPFQGVLPLPSTAAVSQQEAFSIDEIFENEGAIEFGSFQLRNQVEVAFLLEIVMTIEAVLFNS